MASGNQWHGIWESVFLCIFNRNSLFTRWYIYICNSKGNNVVKMPGLPNYNFRALAFFLFVHTACPTTGSHRVLFKNRSIVFFLGINLSSLYGSRYANPKDGSFSMFFSTLCFIQAHVRIFFSPWSSWSCDRTFSPKGGDEKKGESRLAFFFEVKMGRGRSARFILKCSKILTCMLILVNWASSL